MIETRDFGRLFTCKVNLREDVPLVHFAPMWQARWPFWQGYTVIFRNGRVFGIWYNKNPKASEHDLLMRPLRGRDLTDRLPRYTGERTEGSNLPGIIHVEGDHGAVPSISGADGEVGIGRGAEQEGGPEDQEDADDRDTGHGGSDDHGDGTGDNGLP